MTKTFDEMLDLWEERMQLGRVYRTVALVGSSQFGSEFDQVSLRFTREKLWRVYSLGSVTRGDAELGISAAEQIELDLLHWSKIADVDLVCVINARRRGRPYFGPSTANEIRFARYMGIPLEWLNPHECADQHCPCLAPVCCNVCHRPTAQRCRTCGTKALCSEHSPLTICPGCLGRLCERRARGYPPPVAAAAAAIPLLDGGAS